MNKKTDDAAGSHENAGHFIGSSTWFFDFTITRD